LTYILHTSRIGAVSDIETDAGHAPPQGGAGALGAGVILVALNLRAGITSLGAVLGQVQADLGLDDVQAGLLTTLPVLAFATVGALTPLLVRQAGLVVGMLTSGLLLVSGLALRTTAGSSTTLLLWTAVAMAGIAIGNVLLPAAVKRYFPYRLGVMTWLYTMAMQFGSAVAAGGTTPLADASGSWRAGLGAWALLAVLALPPWIITLRMRSRDGRVSCTAGGQRPTEIGLARNPLAWSLAEFFGLQSLSAYVVMGWLPEIYQSAGVDRGTAGVLLAVVMALAAPIALLLPAVAGRLPDQRLLVVAVTVAMAVGWVGLAVAPRSGAWWWAVLLGIGSGAFPLALTLIGLRARTTAMTTSLSAFAQSAGYVLAIAGPLTVGVLHQLTGSWTPSLVLLIALLIPQLVAGLSAGQDRQIQWWKPALSGERGGTHSLRACW